MRFDVSSLIDSVVEVDNTDRLESRIPYSDNVSHYSGNQEKKNKHSRRAALLKMEPSTCSVVTPSTRASPLTVGNKFPSRFRIQILFPFGSTAEVQSLSGELRRDLKSF